MRKQKLEEIFKRYRTSYHKLTEMESLRRSKHDPRELNAPGSPKSQYLEAIERKAAEQEAIRLKKQRQRELRAMMKNKQNGSANNSFTGHLVHKGGSASFAGVASGSGGGPAQEGSLNDSFDDAEQSRADSDGDETDVLDHENFNLDDHLNVVGPQRKRRK